MDILLLAECGKVHEFMNNLDMRKIPVEKLNPAEYNPRIDLQAGDPVYEKLLRSVEEFGYVDPLIWNERTGNLVGGHQRLKILVHLGYTEIDCIVVDIDEPREKALNIALNKIQGDWDLDKLKVCLDELADLGFDNDLVGFEPDEVDKLYNRNERVQGKVDEDDFDAEKEVEAIEIPFTQLGDIWLIGNHRLMCGDSTSEEDVSKLMDGKKAKMIFVDPPWNVDYGGAAHPSWKKRSIINDKMSTDDFYNFLLAAFKNMAAVSEQGCMTYAVMSAQEWGSLMNVMRECGYHWSSTIIWYKNSPVLSRKDYHTKYEPIWYGWLSGAARLCPMTEGDKVSRNQSDVWEIPRPTKSPEHPTMKPVALAGKAIANSSREGDIILDLFGGSGTTLIAAEQTERTSFLMELDPKYADCIVNRYIKFKDGDEGVFLLRDGEKIPWADVPQPPQAEVEGES